MDGVMTLADLIASHKAQLGKVAGRFTAPGDADFVRHLEGAARRLSSKLFYWKGDTISLTAGVGDYPAPVGIMGVPVSDWGPAQRQQPWDDDYLGFPPILLLLTVHDAPTIRIAPSPTSAQIACWGSTLSYRYLAYHQISTDELTFNELQRPLVLLAAMIEALRELAADNTVVQLQKGLAGLPTAGTPAYLYERLLDELDRT